MKKICSFLLTSLMVMTAVLPMGACAAEKTYLDVINSLIDKYGEYEEKYERATGVIYGEWIDFDNNGTEEMLVVCKEKTDEYRENWANVFVYGMENDHAVKLLDMPLYQMGSTGVSYRIVFAELNNKPHIVFDAGVKKLENGYYAGTKVAFTMQENKAVIHQYYAEVSNWEDSESNYINCMLDENEISVEEYHNAIQSIYSNCIEQMLLAGEDRGETRYCSRKKIDAFIEQARRKAANNFDESVDIPDYVALFGELINGQENGNTKLKNLLRSEYQACNASLLKDCYMVDMNNDSVPELLCILHDKENYALHAVLVEYDNGEFHVGEELPFYYTSGSGGSEIHRVLKADGKFYFEEYISGRYNEGSYSEEYVDWTISLNQNGTVSEAYRAKMEGKYYWDTEKWDYTTYYCYVNGQQVDEINYTYTHDNFETVADGYNYQGMNGYEPQYGKDYDKFWDANSIITVMLNGTKISFDQQPVIKDDRTLVPLRAIFEALGATVDWNGDTQTVTSTKEGTTISMTIGQNAMYKNGAAITLDVAPQLIGGRTLVPVRAVAEGFNCKVDWNGDANAVIITSSNAEAEKVMPEDISKTMSKDLLDDFGDLVGASFSSGMVSASGKDLLEDYKQVIQNKRDLVFMFMTDYAGMYLKNKNAFKWNVENVSSNTCRVSAEQMDWVLKNYFNVDSAHELTQLGSAGSETVYYSDGYYYSNLTGRGERLPTALVEKVFSLGNDKYYFVYRQRWEADEYSNKDTVSKKTFYAVVQRKNIDGVEFWSIVDASEDELNMNDYMN